MFPSLYEGFGFPVLEAQACGTAVVCADTSSLPEVAGEGAVVVDPLDVGGLTEAMQLIVRDDGLRVEMVENGYRNLSRFGWEIAAEQILALLEKVVDRQIIL